MTILKRILIIDDDPSICITVKELLEEEGYQVFSAENGLRGLEVLAEIKETLPMLILLDISMPIMNGLEFLAIQKFDPVFKSIPVAIFSAGGGTKPELADDYLRKPFPLESLFQLVDKWCVSPSKRE
jgi:two-component system response regulator CpxR